MLQIYTNQTIITGLTMQNVQPATLVADMPMGWQLSTDATMYSRRGYSDSEMNTDNFVWNIRVGKKLLKG